MQLLFRTVVCPHYPLRGGLHCFNGQQFRTLRGEAMRHCGRCSPAEKPRPPVKEVTQVTDLCLSSSPRSISTSPVLFFGSKPLACYLSYKKSPVILKIHVSLGILGIKTQHFICVPFTDRHYVSKLFMVIFLIKS